MAVIVGDLRAVNIETTDYINAELNIIERFKKNNAISILDWVEMYAVSYHNAVMKLKTLNIELLEKEIYKKRGV